MPGTTVYLSNPTWGNHKNICADSGLEWKEYRYFDPNTIGLDFDGMVADIRNAPEGSVIVLHGAKHSKWPLLLPCMPNHCKRTTQGVAISYAI